MRDKSANNNPGLPSVISQAIENRLKDLHTAMPGIIESFDAASQTVSVQPAIKRIFKLKNGEKEILSPSSLPLLINVPLVFMNSGGYSVTMPVANGDECLLVFSERSIDDWFSKGGVQTPTTRRFHSLSDAFCILGVRSKSRSLSGYSSSNVELRSDDGSQKISMAPNGSIRMENSSGYVELRPDGEFDINGKIFSQHSHAGSPTAPTGPISNTGIPI